MILEPEYKEVNGKRVPKKMSDYTLEELREKLAAYHKSMIRRHGRNPKIKVEERVFEDDFAEKKRLWNNYRSIISRHKKISVEKWRDNLRNKVTTNIELEV